MPDTNTPTAETTTEALAGTTAENADRAAHSPTETGTMSADTSALGGAALGGLTGAAEPTGLQGEGAR